jgi:hypothetical protein
MYSVALLLAHTVAAPSYIRDFQPAARQTTNVKQHKSEKEWQRDIV